jgi:hypothetical protein
MSDLLCCTTKLDEATCFICVLCRITRIVRVDGMIYSTDPIFSSGRSRVLYVFFPYEVIRWRTCSIQDEHLMGCDVTMFCHTCAFRMSNMRGKDTLHSNRGCLKLDALEGPKLQTSEGGVNGTDKNSIQEFGL